MDIETARFNMIEQQIRPWNVLDPAVLALLAVVRREDFVPPSLRTLAFADTQLPLLPGQPQGPRMLEPRVQARLLQALHVQRHEKVLEIGAGAGYMAALLAHRARSVVTLECRPDLAKMARANLRRAGVLNAAVIEVDARAGAQGHASEAPYGAILLSGSVAAVPQALLEQLALGGRLAAIVGEEPAMQAIVYTRTGPSSWTQRVEFDAVAPRLLGFAEKPAFQL
jgi:protein-L-isoaspartate(D-aspartate) O-methyltransferase